MNKRIFNLLLGMLLIVWVVISLILPTKIGLLALFVLGILILVVMFLDFFRFKKRKSVNRDTSVAMEDPTFRDISHELKEIFDKEQGIEEVKVEDKEVKRVEKKPVKKVSTVGPKYVGSSESKKYHLRDCRFAKTVKGKSRIEKTTKNHFVKNEYKACGVCKPDKN